MLAPKVEGFVKRNGSTILTCVGAAGVVLTAVTTVNATTKANKLLNRAREEKGEDLTPMEVFTTALPVFFPVALTGIGTVACIFGANILSKKHQASLISAYGMLNSSYKEYRNKVNELYGEDADEKVQEEMTKANYPRRG